MLSKPDPLLPAAAAEPSHEARLLAQLLRSGRVVLLLGEPHADRGGLIQHGLAPLLARRSTDHVDAAWSGASTAVAPQQDRRGALNQKPERVVIFDCWSAEAGGPLQQLRQSLAATLGVGAAELEAAPQRLDEALVAWTQTRPVHVLLLLHHFEDHLLAPRPGLEHAQVTDELVRLLNRPGLPVSVLLSLTEAAQPHLGSMRSLVPGLEDLSLRLKAGAANSQVREPFMLPLPGAPDSTPGDSFTAKPAVPGRNDNRRGPVERPAIRSDDVYALINTTLSRVATGSSANPLQGRRQASSEPDIEAFQAPSPADGFGPIEPSDANLDTWKDEPWPTTAPPANVKPHAREGWWRRLMQLLGR